MKDVRPYLAISNCLVLPSYREGFPNVVLQAGAMGLPSIVTNINGCNEIVEHRHNGLIVPVKDEHALGEAMREIIEDDQLVQDLVHHSRTKIVENYAQDTMWQAILAEYQEAIKS